MHSDTRRVNTSRSEKERRQRERERERERGRGGKWTRQMRLRVARWDQYWIPRAQWQLDGEDGSQIPNAINPNEYRSFSVFLPRLPFGHPGHFVFLAERVAQS